MYVKYKIHLITCVFKIAQNKHQTINIINITAINNMSVLEDRTLLTTMSLANYMKL